MAEASNRKDEELDEFDNLSEADFSLKFINTKDVDNTSPSNENDFLDSSNQSEETLSSHATQPANEFDGFGVEDAQTPPSFEEYEELDLSDAPDHAEEDMHYSAGVVDEQAAPGSFEIDEEVDLRAESSPNAYLAAQEGLGESEEVDPERVIDDGFDLPNEALSHLDNALADEPDNELEDGFGLPDDALSDLDDALIDESANDLDDAFGLPDDALSDFDDALIDESANDLDDAFGLPDDALSDLDDALIDESANDLDDAFNSTDEPVNQTDNVTHTKEHESEPVTDSQNNDADMAFGDDGALDFSSSTPSKPQQEEQEEAVSNTYHEFDELGNWKLPEDEGLGRETKSSMFDEALTISDDLEDIFDEEVVNEEVVNEEVVNEEVVNEEVVNEEVVNEEDIATKPDSTTPPQSSEVDGLSSTESSDDLFADDQQALKNATSEANERLNEQIKRIHDIAGSQKVGDPDLVQPTHNSDLAVELAKLIKQMQEQMDANSELTNARIDSITKELRQNRLEPDLLDDEDPEQGITAQGQQPYVSLSNLFNWNFSFNRTTKEKAATTQQNQDSPSNQNQDSPSNQNQDNPYESMVAQAQKHTMNRATAANDDFINETLISLNDQIKQRNKLLLGHNQHIDLESENLLLGNPFRKDVPQLAYLNQGQQRSWHGLNEQQVEAFDYNVMSTIAAISNSQPGIAKQLEERYETISKDVTKNKISSMDYGDLGSFSYDPRDMNSVDSMIDHMKEVATKQGGADAVINALNNQHEALSNSIESWYVNPNTSKMLYSKKETEALDLTKEVFKEQLLNGKTDKQNETDIKESKSLIDKIDFKDVGEKITTAFKELAKSVKASLDRFFSGSKSQEKSGISLSA